MLTCGSSSHKKNAALSTVLATCALMLQLWRVKCILLKVIHLPREQTVGFKIYTQLSEKKSCDKY